MACAERLHKEGKYPSLKPKKLKTGGVTRPGGANVLYVPQPVFDPDPMGDGLGNRLTFEGEPGFPGAFLALTDDDSSVSVPAVQLDAHGLGVDDEEDELSEWYTLHETVSEAGQSSGVDSVRVFGVRGEAELNALLSLAKVDDTLVLMSHGIGAIGHDTMLQWREVHAAAAADAVRAELAQLTRREQSVTAAATVNVTEEPMLIWIRERRTTASWWGRRCRFLSLQGAAAPGHRPTAHSRLLRLSANETLRYAAPWCRRSPTSVGPRWFTVFGGPYEGVHEMFDTSLELLPLLATPDSRSYGPDQGITTRAHAISKLASLRAILRVGDELQPVEDFTFHTCTVTTRPTSSPAKTQPCAKSWECMSRPVRLTSRVATARSSDRGAHGARTYVRR